MTVAAIMILGAIALIEIVENRELKKAVSTIDKAYIEFMNLSLKDGSKLGNHIQEGTIGLFTVKDRTAACALLKTKKN